MRPRLEPLPFIGTKIMIEGVEHVVTNMDPLYDPDPNHPAPTSYKVTARRAHKVTEVDYSAIRELQHKCWVASAAKGFHDDRPPVDTQALRDYRGNKLMLIVGKVAEAHEELRKGRSPWLDVVWFLVWSAVALVGLSIIGAIVWFVVLIRFMGDIDERIRR